MKKPLLLAFAISLFSCSLVFAGQDSPKAINYSSVQDGLEADLPYPEVYRDENVVFRRLNGNTLIGSGHVMASETLYLIEGTDRAILLDTGTSIPGLDKIVAKLTDKPVTVVLTHVHPDHAGSVGCFDEVWLNQADSANMKTMMSDYKGRVKYLEDGQKFELGDRTIEVLFTPGHTPGSTTFFDARNGYGFSGDSFGNGNLLLMCDFTTLISSCRKALAKMDETGVTYFYNGHYFGNNPETAQRLKDLITISEGVLSGDIAGEDNPNGMAGLNHVVNKYGVRVNYGDAQIK